MLHTKAVEPHTLSLLKRLMQIPELGNFNLVGGTALALKCGHRISVDLDLFTTDKINIELITEVLTREFKTDFVHENTNVKWAMFCYIQNIKVDFVNYPHSLIESLEIVDGIRMYNNKDIVAMKVNAILGRAAKKDFYDLAELLKKFKLSDIIDFHKQKYPSQMLAISIPNAISYFTEADTDEDPTPLNNQTWENVKKELQKAVRDYLA